MSSITGFTTGGFFMRDPIQIELDYQNYASGVLEEINFSPGDMLYQLLKVIKLREYQMELNTNAIVSGLSAQTAYGDFLEKLCESRGIFKKQQQKAGGFAHLQFNPPSVGANYDLIGTQYLTKTNLIFERSVDSNLLINRYIPLTRGQGMTDPLPSPFMWITGVGYINNESDGSGISDYTPVFNNTYQYFDWNGIGGGTTGMVYYVEITGSMRVRDDIAAAVVGTGSNVGANTIIDWTNNATLPANTIVNNPYSLTGGADWESDEDLRERFLRATNRTFTLANIRSMAEGIQGVRSAHAYQALGTDRTTISGDWVETTAGMDGGIDITGNYSGAGDLDWVSGALWSQRFTPTEGIIGMKRTIFRGKRTGFPPPLVIGLRTTSDVNYLASGIFDTFDVSPPASTTQDYEINIKYLDLDHTRTYRLEFWCSDKTGASGAGYWTTNYWTLMTGDQSGNMGDDITGFLYDPDGVQDNHGNVLMKTQYGSSAFKVDLAVKDGYSFDELRNTLDEKLDWVDGTGFAPIGVDYLINQATDIPIYYNCTIYIKRNTLATLEIIKDRINLQIERYIEGLDPGDNVIYSEIYYRVMEDGDVWRIDDLKIYESGGTQLEDEDIYIKDNEVAVFQSSVINQG